MKQGKRILVNILVVVLALSVLALLVVICAGCGRISEGLENEKSTDDPLYLEQMRASEEAAQRAEEEEKAAEAGETVSTEPTWGTPIPFEVTTFDWTWHYLESGKLVVTVNDVWVITHEDGIPEEGGVYPFDTNLYMGEGWTEYYGHPDYIQEDGAFLEGVFMILANVTVENQDAKCRLEEGDILNTDPYLFKIWNILKLTELDLPRYWNANYFSLYNPDAQHSMGFHLEPGETVTFTVGYLVGDKWDGSTRDLSELALCFKEAPGGRILIPLGLSNEGIEW